MTKMWKKSRTESPVQNLILPFLKFLSSGFDVLLKFRMRDFTEGNPRKSQIETSAR